MGVSSKAFSDPANTDGALQPMDESGRGRNWTHEDALPVHHELPSVSRNPLVLWYGIHLGVTRTNCMPWFGELVTIGTVDWRDPGYFRAHGL